MQVNTDQDILSMLATDKRQAFSMIVSTYSRRIYWHVRRMVNDHEDSNDLVQNIFVKVWENLGRFRGDAKLYTWIYRIASNEALNFLAQRKRRATLSLTDHEDQLATKSVHGNDPGGEEISQRLDQAIHMLPEKQKLVFNLKYFEEMPYNEMAEVTGTSVGALKASYHHAVKKIEDILNGD